MNTGTERKGCVSKRRVSCWTGSLGLRTEILVATASTPTDRWSSKSSSGGNCALAAFCANQGERGRKQQRMVSLLRRFHGIAIPRNIRRTEQTAQGWPAVHFAPQWSVPKEWRSIGSRKRWRLRSDPVNSEDTEGKGGPKQYQSDADCAVRSKRHAKLRRAARAAETHSSHRKNF